MGYYVLSLHQFPLLVLKRDAASLVTSVTEASQFSDSREARILQLKVEEKKGNVQFLSVAHSFPTVPNVDKVSRIKKADLDSRIATY